MDSDATVPAPPALDPGPAIDFDDAAGRATFDTGSFAGRYQAGDAIGRGGMGEVRALADRASGREVAMKVIRRDRTDPVAMRRFAREARVQAQLEHPSIIPVYDLGRDPDGTPYFTMKRVRGQSLAEVLRDGAAAYSPRKLLTVVARVAMALEYAHRRQVVHRDLKPGNVMLGGFDEVYVLDWGLAQVRDPAEGPMLDLSLSSPALAPPQIGDDGAFETDGHHQVGTPGYQAPELLRSRDPVDHRCDVYALGVILFEVLTGERPHRGGSLADIVISTLTTDGASPRQRAPDRDIAPELDALVVACTRLAPAARPARARDVARAIDAFLDGDRDLSRRRELAAAAAERAERALSERRTDGGDEPRARALREVTSALALDPEHPGARRALVHILTEPTPAAAAAAAVAYAPAAIDNFRRAARHAGWMLFLTNLLYLPLVLWMGVRSWPAFGLTVGAVVAMLGATVHYARRPPAGLALPLPHLALSALTMLAGSGLFGPLILIPTVALISGVGYVSTFDGRAGRVIAMTTAVIALPLILQAVGLVPASYRFEDGALAIQPGTTWLPPVATMAFLVVINVVLVAASVLFAARLRRNYAELERRVQIQAWQLGQLVPADARQAMLAPAAGSVPRH